MKYLVVDSKHTQIARSTVAQCDGCFASIHSSATQQVKCPAFGHIRRNGLRKTASGTIYLCSNIEDDLNSTRVFKSKLDAFSTSIDFANQIRKDIASEYDHNLNRITHNLTSLNAHCIQELFALIPQETLTQDIWQQINTVKLVIKSEPDEAAKAFLRIAKNNLAMKLEFVAMRYLDDRAPHPAMKDHPIRKVVLNVLHAFFQDFTDHNVKVSVTDSDIFASIDYDTFHVALYHVIDNATKYVMPQSVLEVEFKTSPPHVEVIFRMLSLPIPATELSQIGDEGFSGETAKHLQLAGHGMGMFRTKRLLAVNKGSIEIYNDIDHAKACKHNGICYEQNEFRIRISASEKVRTFASSAARRRAH